MNDFFLWIALHPYVAIIIALILIVLFAGRKT